MNVGIDQSAYIYVQSPDYFPGGPGGPAVGWSGPIYEYAANLAELLATPSVKVISSGVMQNGAEIPPYAPNQWANGYLWVELRGDKTGQTLSNPWAGRLENFEKYYQIYQYGATTIIVKMGAYDSTDPVPGYVPPTGGGGGGGGGDGGITQLDDEILILIKEIELLILALQPQGLQDPVTCTQLTTQTSRVTSGLTEILKSVKALIEAVKALPGAPVDPVTCTQLTVVVGLLIASLDKDLGAIATAISNAPGEAPVDLTAVVDAIKAAPDGETKAKAVIQFLVDHAGLDAGIGQILTS